MDKVRGDRWNGQYRQKLKFHFRFGSTHFERLYFWQYLEFVFFSNSTFEFSFNFIFLVKLKLKKSMTILMITSNVVLLPSTPILVRDSWLNIPGKAGDYVQLKLSWTILRLCEFHKNLIYTFIYFMHCLFCIWLSCILESWTKNLVQDLGWDMH